jgi:hypothetical protein
MQTWWKMPDYIHEREGFVIRNPDCVRCGRATTTPGHCHEDYILYEKYLDAVRTDKCDPLCSACNLMERKGMRPCPYCVKEYHDKKREKIKYIPDGKEYCWDHRPESEKVQAENRKLVQNQFIKTMRKITNAKRRAFYQDVVKNGKRTN